MAKKLVLEIDLDLIDGSKEEVIALVLDNVLPNIYGFPNDDLRGKVPAIEKGADDVPLAIWSLADIDDKEDAYLYSVQIVEGELPPLPDNTQDESVFAQTKGSYEFMKEVKQ